MNENDTKPSIKLCEKCLRKALNAQYTIELNTHLYTADWTWRMRFGIMKVCLGIIRRLTDIDPRFYLVTLNRGTPTWQKLNKNEQLDPTR